MEELYLGGRVWENCKTNEARPWLLGSFTTCSCFHSVMWKSQLRKGKLASWARCIALQAAPHRTVGTLPLESLKIRPSHEEDTWQGYGRCTISAWRCSRCLPGHLSPALFSGWYGRWVIARNWNLKNRKWRTHWGQCSGSVLHPVSLCCSLWVTLRGC